MIAPVYASSDRKTTALVCGSAIATREGPGVPLSALRALLRVGGRLGAALTAWVAGRTVGTAAAVAAKTGCARKSTTLVTGIEATPVITIAPSGREIVSQAISFLAWTPCASLPYYSRRSGFCAAPPNGPSGNSLKV